MTIQPIGIQQGMRELGRIRLGKKGDKGQPQKLTKFRLTSASEFLIAKVAEVYGGTCQPWPDAPDEGMFQVFTDSNELEVLLVPKVNDHGVLSFAYSQHYEMWSGGGCKRRCDGITEMLSDKPCMCDPDDRKCDITTRASLMLPRIPSLGVWRLDTKGYYAATELPGIFNLLASFAHLGRPLPAVLRLEQRSVKRPKPDGSGVQTQRFIVPVIDLPGVTLADAVPQMMSFNAPLLPPAGKPELPSGTGLPDDASFDRSPPLGDQPPLPQNGGQRAEPSTGAVGNGAGGELFGDAKTVDVDALRKKIFAQFKHLQIGTPERRALVQNRYALDSFSDLDASQMSDLSSWLASASADELTAAFKTGS